MLSIYLTSYNLWRCTHCNISCPRWKLSWNATGLMIQMLTVKCKHCHHHFFSLMCVPFKEDKKINEWLSINNCLQMHLQLWILWWRKHLFRFLHRSEHPCRFMNSTFSAILQISHSWIHHPPEISFCDGLQPLATCYTLSNQLLLSSYLLQS